MILLEINNYKMSIPDKKSLLIAIINQYISDEEKIIPDIGTLDNILSINARLLVKYERIKKDIFSEVIRTINLERKREFDELIDKTNKLLKNIYIPPNSKK